MTLLSRVASEYASGAGYRTLSSLPHRRSRTLVCGLGKTWPFFSTSTPIRLLVGAGPCKQPQSVTSKGLIVD
uniref:Uncharacterized protein n=1 Tax=Salix viminalis TaxID=40686 RepID=A0A6N2KNC1_SALVM